MAREIKFRAWDRFQKQFIAELYRFWVLGNGSVWERDQYGDPSLANEWLEIQQFTGLKDKNGKEIYEGDIVDEFRSSRSFPEGRHIKRVIEWNNNMTLDDTYGCTAVGFNMFGGELEVIGNIYENPALLKTT